MSTTFPTALDTLTNPTVNHTLATGLHSAQHANANDAIEALQAKVGIDGSADPASLDKRVSDLESSPADGAVMMTGFPVDSSGNYLCTLTYNETTRTVTLTPTGSTFDVWIAGIRHTFTGAQSIQHGAQQGRHFIYVDETGTIVTSQTPWDILKHGMFAYVFRDATNSLSICFDERHHAGRDLYWHRNQHAAEGTKATSGFGISGYTLTDGSTDAAVTFAVATGRAEDEDVIVDTQVLPDGGPYTIMHRSGAAGDWLINRASVLPFRHSANVLQYNQLNTGVWGLSNVTEDQFVNYWIVGATSIPTTDYTPSPTTTQQIIIFPGQAIYSTEAAAHAESFGNMSWGTVPIAEMVPLYQVTLRYNAVAPSAYTNTARCAISRLVRIVGSGNSITQTASADHGALAGLTDDDHSQYSMSAPLAAAVTYNASGTTTVTLDNGRTEVFTATAATGATTWAFANPATTGKVSDFTLELTNGGSQTQTWPASVDWDGGTAPTLTAAGLDVLAFYTKNGGTTWFGFLAAKDIK